jgi:hypothetical protein
MCSLRATRELVEGAFEVEFPGFALVETGDGLAPFLRVQAQAADEVFRLGDFRLGDAAVGLEYMPQAGEKGAHEHAAHAALIHQPPDETVEQVARQQPNQGPEPAALEQAQDAEHDLAPPVAGHAQGRGPAAGRRTLR